ncbi:MAG: hypothetical protein AAFV88_22235 [Planctomycetota bacterium]
MDANFRVPPIRRSVIPSWQSFPAKLQTKQMAAWTAGLSLLLGLLLAEAAHADLFDALDAYPPRWRLDTSDCEARVLEHINDSGGGVDGKGCERFTIDARLGSQVILLYSIEPSHPLDDLVAQLSLMSARGGARVGLRVRYPYSRDSETGRPISTIVYGGSYDRPGKYQSLGVGSIESDLRVKTAKLRMELGRDVDLTDPYVDAIAINAYSGPGKTTLRIDSLSARGLVPAGQNGHIASLPDLNPKASASPRPNRKGDGSSTVRLKQRSSLITGTRDPFPGGETLRILEHRGEPLAWVRSLGFDAVLLSSPPTDAILREAIQSQMLIYAPPPTSPDPRIRTLLDPVAAWYLGGGIALDRRRLQQTDSTINRLNQFPEIWRRPVVIAPVESWADYAELAGGQVWDAALRSRRVSASEQSELFAKRRRKTGNRVGLAVAIHSSCPDEMRLMNQAIESSLGVPEPGLFHWHSMMTQLMGALEQTPEAILFRSSDSLATGTMIAQQRSMALSYLNRLIASISPWLATSTFSGVLPVEGSNYRCSVLESEGDQFLIVTSQANFGEQTLAGDGGSISLELPPEYRGRTIWRLTGFRSERLVPESSSQGLRLQIVSPDVSEVLAVSRDASLGTRLDRSAGRFIAKAAADRWQLALEHLRRCREDWNQATISGATDSISPVELLTVAQQTLGDAERLYRAGEWSEVLRLARRADAWVSRANVQLTQALRPKDAAGQPLAYCSCPPIDQGHAMLQATWSPVMSDDGWSDNLLATGGLDSPSVLTQSGWTFASRKMNRAVSDARWIGRGYFDGKGAVRLSAASTISEPLGGGYEGTVAMFSSPPVAAKERSTVRVDVMVETIGFDQPDQGVLVYDSVGGQELGVLVRGASRWTPVRLYRQMEEATPVQVFFEVIGDGEATIDEVQIRAWQPEALEPLPLIPIVR